MHILGKQTDINRKRKKLEKSNKIVLQFLGQIVSYVKFFKRRQNKRILTQKYYQENFKFQVIKKFNFNASQNTSINNIVIFYIKTSINQE
ncbi:unnamed protein product [Paramecium sonneborni]|uniref:Uncharacterized protein n=1 Tax=Paramecium sonneborni TaxID=65129 RepID=A0A8S1NGS4_9CILI|nr:unnamed protein product [Paramecium sonneborni]